MHLKENFLSPGQIVGHDMVIGLLEKTGNAAKTPAHMHYSILTPVPHFWLYNKIYCKKMFYLNPDEYLRSKRHWQSRLFL